MDLKKYNPNTNFILYKTSNGDVKIDVLLENKTIWMSQRQISELFGVQRSAITKHLNNIFKSRELDEKVVCSILELPTQHGAIKGKIQHIKTKFYNLDAIIAVGYRVNSNRATQFRIWATNVLQEFIIKGYTMDVERLKNPNPLFGEDYFKEQLEKIRDIRSSERRLYQQITDIYAECSIDYEYESKTTKKFFATVQNKLHWAITNSTAAEIIMNRIVTMYLDYAENQAEKGIVMTMKDWTKKLDAFLEFNQEDILNNLGKVTAKIARVFAEGEYEKYKVIQDKFFESDFDREIKKIMG